MPPEVLDSYIKTKGAGSHAEIYVVNKLLLDNPNAQISDIAIYVNYKSTIYLRLRALVEALSL